MFKVVQNINGSFLGPVLSRTLVGRGTFFSVRLTNFSTAGKKAKVLYSHVRNPCNAAKTISITFLKPIKI